MHPLNKVTESIVLLSKRIREQKWNIRCENDETKNWTKHSIAQQFGAEFDAILKRMQPTLGNEGSADLAPSILQGLFPNSLLTISWLSLYQADGNSQFPTGKVHQLI